MYKLFARSEPPLMKFAKPEGGGHDELRQNCPNTISTKSEKPL